MNETLAGRAEELAHLADLIRASLTLADCMIPSINTRLTELAELGIDNFEIEGWQIIAGMAEARLIVERRLARPHPIVEIGLPLPNGDRCKVVWSLLRREKVAKLVTTHLLDDDEASDEG